jgi:hypothetical protein
VKGEEEYVWFLDVFTSASPNEAKQGQFKIWGCLLTLWGRKEEGKEEED